MSRYIKVKKSKNLRSKLISLMYLISFVLYFLSTSGDFVSQFVPLSVTQENLNKKLREQFDNYNATIIDEVNLKTKAINALIVLDDIKLELQEFSDKVILKREFLKDRRFAKKYLRNNENAEKMHKSFKAFINCFPEETRASLILDLGMKLEMLSQETSNNEFFFETPNGAVKSVLNHCETIILSESLKYFKQDVRDDGMIKVVSSKDSSLLQGFKGTYYVGEDIKFDFFSRDSVAPTISINQVSMTPNYKGSHYIINWTPTKDGSYNLVAFIGDNFIRHTLTVINPKLRFLEKEQEIAAFLSEPFYLTVDMEDFSEIKDLTFTSKGAKIETKKEQLIVTPLYEGRFTIEMRSGNIVLDSRSIFAAIGNPPLVSLKDIAGKKTEMLDAHCLESTNAYWQVVNFTATIVYPTGESKVFKSNTRYIRNELKSIEQSAPSGSTIIFNDIRLLNANGISTTTGLPIFIVK
jgi:hypothetical protein